MEYKSEHAEVASALLSGQNTLAVLPEPYVTNVMAKDTPRCEPVAVEPE